MAKKLLKTLLMGILAGAAIGLGSLLFVILSAANLKFVGALCFSIGLLLVCSFSLYLYTGKIGFILQSENRKQYVIELLIGILGNLIGAVILGYLTRILFINNEAVMNSISAICALRKVRFDSLDINDVVFYKTLISSIFCGMLVFIAVYGWKKESWSPLLKILLLVFSVFAFVASGFEHCIANMYYLSFGNAWNLNTIFNVIIVILGNSIGALLLSVLTKIK